jgi:hypothetical protein
MDQDRMKIWESMASANVEFLDPRFEMDAVSLTVIAAENFQKAVALLVLNRIEEARTYLSKTLLAVKCKLNNLTFADYPDLLYWQLVSWLTEDNRDRPDAGELMEAKHHQIIYEVEEERAKNAYTWYQKAAALMHYSWAPKTSPRQVSSPNDKFYDRLASRFLELARMLLWRDDPRSESSIIKALHGVSEESMYCAQNALAKKLGISDPELRQIQLTDLDTLRELSKEKFPVFMEMKNWEEKRMNFFHLQWDFISALAGFLWTPGKGELGRADLALEKMFQEERNLQHQAFSGLDLLDQIQWAWVGGKYILESHSKKPVNVIRYYLAGVGKKDAEIKRISDDVARTFMSVISITDSGKAK